MNGPGSVQSDNMDWMPLILSLLAGLSTCLGASVVFFTRERTSSSGKPESPLSHKHMSFSLALAGSVMVTVSFFSLLPESFSLEDEEDLSNGSLLPVTSRLFWMRTGSFFVGCLLYWLLSKCAFPEPDAILGYEPLSLDDDVEALPNASTDADHDVPPTSSITRSASSSSSKKLRIRNTSQLENATPNSSTAVSEPSMDDDRDKSETSNWRRFSSGSDLSTHEARRAWRVAMLLFVSLAVHNFPEGFAVAASSIHSPKLGLTTAIAIAFHNVPEGIAIAVPCLAARPDSPWLAFWLASLSGLAEPLGAVVALLCLRRSSVSDTSEVMGITSFFLSTKNVLSFVAGVMTMVALNELFPEALRHSKQERSRTSFVAGTLLGAVIMIASDAFLDEAA